MTECEGDGGPRGWDKLAVSRAAAPEQICLCPGCQLRLLAWLSLPADCLGAAQAQLPLPQQVSHLGAPGAHGACRDALLDEACVLLCDLSQ